MLNCGLHVEVHQSNITGVGTTVKVDGKKINGVLGVRYEVSAGDVPEVTISKYGTNDLDINCAYIKLDISPQNVMEAVRILRDELLKHGDFYEGFLSSIESSVKEQELQGLPFQPDREIAEKILKRIIGEE